MLSWLLHVIGVEPRTPSTAYNFWSGFGSDIGEAGIVAGLYHKHNCHERGCWRIGRHVTVEDGVQVLRCTKHHHAR